MERADVALADPAKPAVVTSGYDPAAPRCLAVVAAPREIDAASAGPLQDVLLAAVESGHDTVVVDLSLSQFCDCAGLGVLIRAHKQARARGGELRVLLPSSGIVSRLFVLTRLSRTIPVFTRLEDALA